MHQRWVLLRPLLLLVTCECKDCDECLPMEVRLPSQAPRDAPITIKSWDSVGKDIKRTHDGVSYMTVRSYEEETHPQPHEEVKQPRKEEKLSHAVEERKLPEPRKTAAGSAVFGVRSLKAAKETSE